MDLNQPWEVRKGRFGNMDFLDVGGENVGSLYAPDVAAQIVLWARAEEVQRRRGWHAMPANDDCTLWEVWSGDGVWWHRKAPDVSQWPTPAEALVAADEWLTAQEKQP